jgi:uncharacterized membrane protein YgcG
MQVRITILVLLIGGLVFGGLQRSYGQNGQGIFEYINPSSFQQIIREEATQLGKERGLAEADLQARIAGALVPLTKRLQKSLEKDKTLSGRSSTSLSAKDKQIFEGAIRKKIKLLLREKDDNLYWFFFPNNNDRILSFHSDIQVGQDGLLQVKETIVIYNGDGQESSGATNNSFAVYNNDIQRGIVRDFPTRYLSKQGFWQNMGFHIKSLTQNGTPAKYREENLDNGIRVMVGSEDVYLPSGIYTYEINYETNQQLIFHQDKDELYWNVNGNGWVFPIDSASCKIRFPEGAQIFENACYTGFQGSREQSCYSRQTGPNQIAFSTVERLVPYQGLTVAAAIQKGILQPPAKSTMSSFLTDNYGLTILGGLFLVLAAFYTFIWSKKGKDPPSGTIFPQFEPPANLTAADCGYILKQKFSSELFAAALVEMAVKGWLKIEVTVKKFIISTSVYHFKKPAGQPSYPSTQKDYGFEVRELHGQKAEKGVYNATLKAKYDALQGQLKNRFLVRKGKSNAWNGLFILNNGYTIFGGLLIFAAGFIGIAFLINYYSQQILIASLILLLMLVVLQIFFVSIMSAYTQKGREVADHIKGFKMYLETAEQKLLNYLTPPEKTLELFEKYLPYAIALGVENAWADKFDSILQKALEGGYQPGYYSGNSHGSFGNNFHVGDLTKGISSGLSSTVSSASTPPSSSSGGSSGGGSSGGGGGGGGGGGW